MASPDLPIDASARPISDDSVTSTSGLSGSQRAMRAARRAERRGLPITEVAASFNISTTIVHNAARVLRSGDEALCAAVLDGRMSVKAAIRRLTPGETFRAVPAGDKSYVPPGVAADHYSHLRLQALARIADALEVVGLAMDRTDGLHPEITDVEAAASLARINAATRNITRLKNLLKERAR